MFESAEVYTAALRGAKSEILVHNGGVMLKPSLGRIKGTVFVLAVIVATVLNFQGCGVGSEPSITVTPDSGPAGSEVTITISDALPNAPVTLFVGPSSTNLTTDASGNVSTSQTMDFPVGAVEIRAIIGGANEQNVSTTFTVTQ